MSLTSGIETKSANSRNAPVTLILPTRKETWNYIDVSRDANNIDAEITFDSGTTWLPFPGSKSSWSGPFPSSTNSVSVRPKVDGQSVTGLFALARKVIYQAI